MQMQRMNVVLRAMCMVVMGALHACETDPVRMTRHYVRQYAGMIERVLSRRNDVFQHYGTWLVRYMRNSIDPRLESLTRCGVIPYQQSYHERPVATLIHDDMHQLVVPHEPYTYDMVVRNMLAALNNGAMNGLVCTFNGACIGCITYTACGDEGLIDTLVVDSRCRRCGVGTCLLSSAIARLERVGVHMISVLTRYDNTQARTVYERYGFVMSSSESPCLVEYQYSCQ